jgi:methionyl-tRNA formyltransferase
MLAAPALGCLNVHPSLLPRHRGPSPVATAILNGDAETGVSIMEMDQGMDSGPIVARRATPIGPRENAGALTERLFRMGSTLLLEVLPGWTRGEIRAQPQDGSQATLTRLLSREDGRIDWGLGAERIARQVLAFHPWPGSFTLWKGKTLKVIEAYAPEPEAAGPSPPGLVVSLHGVGPGIATGRGVLAVQRLQLEGKRPLGAAEFLRGYPDFVGARLGE